MVCYVRKFNSLKPFGGNSGESLSCIAALSGFILGDTMPILCIDCGNRTARQEKGTLRCRKCRLLDMKENSRGRTLPDCKKCGKKLSTKKNSTGLCQKCMMTGHVPWNKGVKGLIPWNKGKSRFKTKEDYRVHKNKVRIILRQSRPPKYHIADRIRTLVRNSLSRRGIVKRRLHTKTTDILGCSIKDFEAHLESQFVDGMCWSNYGNGQGRWSIDHIIPVMAFDLSTMEEIKKAFHFTNCQPLWAIDNIRKGCRCLRRVC